MGMSMSRYLPAIGTAGFERILVKGCKRDPLPPPIITPRTLLIDGMTDLHVLDCGGTCHAWICCYLLINFRSWRTFPKINTKGYVRVIGTTLTATLTFSLTPPRQPDRG